MAFDPLVWIAGLDQLLLGFLGALVTLQDTWAKRHKILLVTVFAVLGLVGCWASIKQAASTTQMQVGLATGGDSYCFLFFNRLDSDQNYLSLQHFGTYPLHNVTATLVDLKLYESNNPSSQKAASRRFKLGDVIPHTVSPVSPFTLNKSGVQNFTVNFVAMNGEWWEDIRMRKVNGKWIEANRVWMSDPTGKRQAVLSVVPPDFPGSPDWEP